MARVDEGMVRAESVCCRGGPGAGECGVAASGLAAGGGAAAGVSDVGADGGAGGGRGATDGVFECRFAWLPVGEERWLATGVFLAGTLAGVPVVLGVWWVFVAVVRGRWRRVLAMAGLVVVATMLVAAAWIWVDRKAMAGIEHYGWEGWELVVMVGAYGAAVLWGVGRMLLEAYRLVRWRRL